MSSVSIIVCTRNRAESLRQTLVSIGHCAVPAELRTELIVVDNGSTDDTARVVREAELPNALTARYQLEKHPGLSHARNAALGSSTGDILLFTDDDVRVPAQWIGGMCRLILSGEADAVAGGVHFPAAYEQKLSREPFRSRRGWLATTEGTDPREPGCLIGANMAFGRHVTGAVGDFDPALGAGALGFCEESLFAYRLLDAGLRIRAAFDVSVEHHFDLTRLTSATLSDMSARMGTFRRLRRLPLGASRCRRGALASAAGRDPPALRAAEDSLAFADWRLRPATSAARAKPRLLAETRRACRATAPLPAQDVRRVATGTEEVGFEPTDPCGSPVFKTGALDRSATPP